MFGLIEVKTPFQISRASHTSKQNRLGPCIPSFTIYKYMCKNEHKIGDRQG